MECFEGRVHVPKRMGIVVVTLRARFDPDRGGLSLRLMPEGAREMAEALCKAAKEAEAQ